MALLLLVIAMLLLLTFGGVILVGAPYVPTLTPQAKTALELLDLKKGQTMLELGCGDGKLLVLAAEQGLNAVGIELNPFLAFIAWARTRRYHGRVRVIWGDLWRVDWPEADGVFSFLLGRFMPKLDSRMKTYRKPLASFAFEIPGRRPDAARNGILLYKY